MLDAIKKNFGVSENQLIIQEMAKKYQLSSFEYIALIDILMYYYTINNTPNTLHITKLICDKITFYRDKLRINQTGELFTSCLKAIIEEISSDEASITNLEQFLESGYVFHSFNAAFFDKISTQGLVVKDKPWSLEEVEEIRQLLKHKASNIFGLYKTTDATPVFFTDSLTTSPYYGLSSPTFFRKFIENKKEYFNVFLNRDFELAKKSIGELCIGLNSEDKRKVFDFFYKYWHMFTNDELPYVAITTQKKLGIEAQLPERFPNETTEDYYVRCLLSSRNHMIKGDVSHDKLDLFSYSSLSFKTKEKEKYIV